MVETRRDGMAEIKLHEGESIENALRRFKRKVMQEDIIKEVKKHSFYLETGRKETHQTSISPETPAGRKCVANPSKSESSQPPKNIRPTRILLGWQKKSSLEISRFKSQKLTLVICSARSAELNPFKSSRIAIPDARKVSALYR